MVTIKDVAKKAGVSTATISRVINNKGSLSGKTIAKVNKAMNELGYSPNSLARSLVKGLSTCIGVILPSLKQPYWALVANELERVAAKMGYTVMITVSEDDPELYKKKYASLEASRPVGIVTSYINDTEDFISKSSVPTVIWANTNYSPSVASDDYQGGVLATRHLIAKGCRNLIHVGGNLKGRSSKKLQEEFPHLRKEYWGQHMWATGYFCRSVGTVTQDIIKEYIANQKESSDDIFVTHGML